MTIYCPNYRCHLPQPTAKVCSDCGTTLDIHGSINGQAITYQLTKVLQDSSGKIKDDGEYCWYELFQVQANGANFVIKMLIIVPDRLSPSNNNHISKVKMRFQREYDLLCKGLEGVCKGYEILDIPIGTEMVRSIVMEEIAGLNLEEYVELNRPIDSQRAIRWMKQLATIINGLHKNQVQHRDIKPSNIIITGQSPNEQMTLVDFGVSLDRGNRREDETNTAIFGTPPYLDPVYISSGQYLNDSDFYSLGQTFIYLLTGQFPEDDWEKDHNIAHPPIDTKLKNTIQRMVSLSPTKRFKTSEQILRHLDGHYLPKWLKLIIFAIVGLISSLLIYFISRPPSTSYNTVEKPVYVHPICEIERINCGKSSSISTGINEAFKKISSPDQKKRQEGLNKYKDVWEYTMAEKKKGGGNGEQDGEHLIYWNNSKIQVDSPKAEIFTLLVAIPPYNKPQHVSEHILRGISQAQKDFNDKNTNVKLYIAILHEPETNKEKHEDLGKIISDALQMPEEKIFNNKFIGTIGHYSSQVTFDVLRFYAESKMLLLSPSAASSDIPNEKTTFGSDISEYFSRVVPSRRAYEVSNLLRQLANNNSNCDLLDIYLIYQEDDIYSNSLGIELKDLFYLTNTSTVRNTLIHDMGYKLGSKNVAKLKDEILLDLKKQLETSKSLTMKNCKPKQVVIFFPGPYTTSDQSDIIQAMAKEIPKKASFVGNMTLDILSDTNIQKKINDSDLYSRTFIIAPFDILDFLPSYFSTQKPTTYVKDISLIKSMVNNTSNGDISDVNWRQISSADSVRTFVEAIKIYQKETNKSTNEKPSKIVHDIIKRKDFSADGTFDKIQFNGYERKGVKGITLLKYIRHEKNTEMVTVPIGYRDPKSPDQESRTYRPLHLDELKIQAK
jgi:serine/threonine protein kinase